MLSLLQGAERTSDSYQLNNYVFARHLYAYHAIASEVDGHIVEPGCGEGYGAILLSRFAEKYTAVDKRKPSAPLPDRVMFIQARLPDLSFIPDKTADTVVCFQVLEHIKSDEFFLGEIYRILKKGGELFLTTPNRWTTLTRNPFHIREYSPDELGKLAGKIFTDAEVKGIYGNHRVQHYYEQNKKLVSKICRLDIFNLQYNLPGWILRTPYTLMNNISRFILYTSMSLENEIHFTDFHLDRVSISSLDLFLHARK